MDAERLIISRLLPKTGQDSGYQAGDDGFTQWGWWKHHLVNANRVRFIALTLNGDDVVIDRATELMWPAEAGEAGCYDGNNITFDGGLAYATALVFAGFNDWYLPNIAELHSLKDYDNWNPQIDTDYFTALDSQYGSSTTNPRYTTERIVINFGSGGVASSTKTTTKAFRAVRRL